jgi:hypothetical protein
VERDRGERRHERGERERRDLVEGVDLLSSDVADIYSRVSSPQLSCWNKGARKKNSSSSDHTIATNKATCGDDGVHPDDGVVFDVTRGQDGTMTDGHMVLDHHSRWEIGVEVLGVIDHHFVLNVGVGADGDGVVVASEHGTIPDLREEGEEKKESEDKERERVGAAGRATHRCLS